MPARKIGVKTASVSSRFFSLKMRRLVSAESLLETSYCFLWELCPKIVSYCEQPITLEYKNLKYTPDFELNFGEIKILVEIKPSKNFDKVLPKIKIFENYLSFSSHNYFPQIFLFSEKDLLPWQVKHLKDVYFRLLNSTPQDSPNLSCPFTGKKFTCPIRKNFSKF
ncbi:MAG: hypothetical protein J7K20_02790 [Thermodesulfobacterium sp.]|nr:hypothetical protein [Thermodesulfobacterium sp.]